MRLPLVLLLTVCGVIQVLASRFARADSAFEILSLSTGGQQGDSESFTPSISADGRIVVFGSDDSIGRPPGLNAGVGGSIYVRDRVTGQTTRITDKVAASSRTFAIGADDESYRPAVSG